MSRFERKYCLESIDEKLLAQRYLCSDTVLHFKTAFPKRKVHNIYFDDLNHTSLYENTDGLFNKRKIRVRWYDQGADYRLEIKSKCGDLGSKKVYDFKKPSTDPEQLLQGLSRYKNLLNIFPELAAGREGEELYYLQDYYPVSYTVYDRQYQVSSVSDVRLTVDSNLLLYNLRNGYLEQVPYRRGMEIYEIKYDSCDNRGIRLFEKFMGGFPLRMTRFSKFANSSHLAEWL